MRYLLLKKWGGKGGGLKKKKKIASEAREETQHLVMPMGSSLQGLYLKNNN